MEAEKRAVRVVKSSRVVPDVETPRHELWLSNLDLTATRGHAPIFYVYKPNGDPEFFSTEVLKASLSKALVPFYPIAGRLVTGRGGRVEVDCNGEGVIFVEGESDSTMDEFGDFVPSSEIRQMLVPAVPSGDPPCVLLLLQVTRFKCGGVTLGVAIHHAATDGLAILHFISTWADMARGVDEPLLPFIDRSILRARSPARVLFEHSAYRPHSTAGVPPAKSNPFSTAVLHLSEAQLAVLKSSCSKVRLSTFKAVVSHVWRCFCMARRLSDNVDSRLHMAADARTRLNPPLPQGFLGNAVFRTSVSAKVGDIVSDALNCTGSKIHEAVSVSMLGDKYVRSLVDFLELQGDLRRLAKGSWTPPTTDLWVVSWLGLPIYEADFGWGRPALVRRACLQFSGLFYVMRSPKMDGGVSLALSLEHEHLLAFEKTFFHGLSDSAVGIGSTDSMTMKIGQAKL